MNDIGQHERVIQFSLNIMSFPTKAHAESLFNHAIHSHTLAKGVALLWIGIHGLSAILLTYGMLRLFMHLKTDKKRFNQQKLTCFLGLTFSISTYILLLGFGSMDYFLSWMQQIDFNGDITAYCLPLIGALLYLAMDESVINA